jgi:choline/glycine/proline betaine transport protein
LKRGGLHYDLYGFEESTIINDIITQFEKYLRFVHTSPGTLPWNMNEHDELLNDSTTNK